MTLMDHTRTVHIPTDRFSGRCDNCIYPVVVENPEWNSDRLNVPCPNPSCSAMVKLERLYGSFNNTNCDARCQYALGNECSCACGGMNHQKGYIPLIPNGELPASVVAKYRETYAKRKAAAQKRSDAARERKAKALDDARQSWFDQNPKVVEILARDDLDWCYAVQNVRWAVNKYGSAFDSKVARMIEIVEESDRKKAAEANRPVWTKVPVPTGKRISIEGVIVKSDWRYNDYSPDPVKKIIVSCGREDNNETYAVWMTCPRSILSADRGDRVRMVVDIEQSKDDPSFGFGKRPTKAEIIGHTDDAPELDSLAAPEF